MTVTDDRVRAVRNDPDLPPVAVEEPFRPSPVKKGVLALIALAAALGWVMLALVRGEWAPDDVSQAKVQLLMSFDDAAGSSRDVPDPYYSDAAMFDTVLRSISQASAALFRQIEPAIRRGVS